MSKFIPRLAVTLVSLACAFVLTSRAEAEEVEPLPDKQGGSATTTKTEDVSTLLSSLSADDIRTAFEVERRLAVLASSLDEAARARAYEQFAVRVVSLAPEWCKAPYALESRLAEERVTPRIVPPSAETPRSWGVEPTLFGFSTSDSIMMFDAEYKVSMLGNTLSRTPLTPCTDCSGSPMDHRSFDDWGAYWRAIDGAWDGIETVNELGLWTAPLQIQRSSYEIEQLEDAGENVRPLTVAGRPVVVDISDGDLSVKWGEHTLVSARIAQWRPCDEREKDCFRESPDHVAAWMWSEHIYVVGNLSQTTESALVRFSPPPDLPSPLIACRHGRSVGLSLRVRALLAAHGVSPPAGTSSAEGKTSARDHGLSKRLEAIEAAMDAKNAKALKPLLTALGKAAARPHDVLVPAWLTWVELARDRQEHAQKEAKRVLADVPRHAATCKAQIAVYERAEEAERRASASGQVSVAMAKNKAKRNAAKLICEASQGLQDAVEKYKRLGMSDSADAVRRAHRFCFDICD